MIPRHPKGGSLNELLLARFAAAGYPEVRASYGSVLVPLFAEDGRAYRISLTARGRRFQAVAEGVIAELESRLGARKRDALVRALEGVMDL